MTAFRPPLERDWPAILDVANRSVAGVPGAGTQEEWLQNRRSFPGQGYQYHVVLADGDDVLGYGAVERAEGGSPGAYRLFVVTLPGRLEDIGLQIHAHLHQKLSELGAVGAWFVEYAEDRVLTSFLRGLGYREIRRFRLESGAEAIVLSMALAHDT